MPIKRAVVGNLVRHEMDAKHESLMQDYLLLQEEFATLKDRVHYAKTRRATLLAEVRFLRRRLKKLKETPHTSKEISIRFAIPQKAIDKVIAPEPSAMSPKNNLPVLTKFPAFRKPFLTSGSHHTTKQKPFNDNIPLVSALKAPIFSISRDVFVTAMPEKRKISWQDQISLECK